MGMASKVQKIMTQPINLIFRFLQNKTRVQIWLYENTDMRIEGRIIGFDEDSAQGGQHYADDERRAPRGLRPHRTGSRLVASPSSKAQLAALCFSESVRCVDPV